MHRLMTAISVAVIVFGMVSGSLHAQTAKKVSKQEAMSAAVTKVQPVYPPVARQLNIEGGVELEAAINEDGTVDQVKIVSGNPVLTKPSVEALKKWKFKPFTEDGKAVQAIATFHFTFSKTM
jgi:periplasmic protein TonB